MVPRRMDGQGLRRRDFLHVGAVALLGLDLPRLWASETVAGGRHAKNVILVWLRGGPSTIDMWDLKPSAKASIRGEFKPMTTSAMGVTICEHLPEMSRQMHRCTLIRSVAHTIAEHGQGTEYVLTGNALSPALKYPSLDPSSRAVQPPMLLAPCRPTSI